MLRVLGVLCVLSVMQAAYVHTNTLKAKRLLTRRSQTSQILGQQLELRHGHGTVGWARGWRGSTPGVATHPNSDSRGKHALWNYRIQRLIDLLLLWLPNRNWAAFRVTIVTLIPVNYFPDTIVRRMCTNCELFPRWQ